MKILFEAHRGVSTEYPENTMPAYRAALDEAIAFGADIIETTGTVKPKKDIISRTNKNGNQKQGLPFF